MAKRKKRNTGKKKAKASSSLKDRLLAFWRGRSPVLSFVLRFVVLMGLFYALFTSSFFQEYIFAPINSLNAGIASFFLNLFGQNVTAFQQTINSAAFSVNIAIGCDGIEPTVGYILTVALTPLLWKSRLKGIIIGTLSLLGLNLLRIISLFLTGAYAPGFFDLMHLDIWQAVFLIITIGCYLFWLNYAIKKQTEGKVKVQK